MERGFLSSKGSTGGGVKEKQHGLYGLATNGIDHVPNEDINLGTCFVNEFGNGGNGDVNEYGNEGLESSSNRLKNSSLNKDGVVNVNKTSDTDVDSVMAGDDNMHYENVGQTPSNSTTNLNKGTSYANLFTRESSRKSVNFCTFITPTRKEAGVVVPLESICATSERFTNTAYGFFLGKRFSSKDGMDAILENCPLFIRNNPSILKKWDPDVNLLKEDVGN
ncbi:hypothetical protein Tco_1384474 [Tanacetum coccineum]